MLQQTTISRNEWLNWSTSCRYYTYNCSKSCTHSDGVSTVGFQTLRFFANRASRSCRPSFVAACWVSTSAVETTRCGSFFAKSWRVSLSALELICNCNGSMSGWPLIASPLSMLFHTWSHLWRSWHDRHDLWHHPHLGWEDGTWRICSLRHHRKDSERPFWLRWTLCLSLVYVRHSLLDMKCAYNILTQGFSRLRLWRYRYNRW